MISRLALIVTGYVAALSLVVVAPPGTPVAAAAVASKVGTGPSAVESSEGSAGFRQEHDYLNASADLELAEPAVCTDGGEAWIGLYAYDYFAAPIGGAAAHVTCEGGKSMVSAELLSVAGWVPAGVEVRFGDLLRFSQSCTVDTDCSTTISNETLRQQASLVNEFDWGPWLGYTGISRASDALPPAYDTLLLTDVRVNGKPVARHSGTLAKMIKADHTVIYGTRVPSKGVLRLHWRL